ncbi:MAG: glycosyltransferase family 2 protein [Patescibacteria group bacterium]
MSKKITAIIPTLSNLDGLKYLVNFLSSSYLVIIDNQPTPQKKQLCQDKNITYLPQSKNIGFAVAINLGAKNIKTPWMLILNDDTEFLEKNTLEKLIKIAEKNNWSAVSPVLQKPDGEIENLGYTVLPHGKIKLNYDPQLKKLDGITAACLLIKTDVFKSLRGFDERFFAYLEDVDLFIRLKKAGYKFGIAQDIKVIHNHMTTSSKMGNFKAKMDLRNWCFLIIKNWDSKTLIKHLIPIILERLRNLLGYLKATHKQHSWKSIFIAPKDLISITIDLFYFVFKF